MSAGAARAWMLHDLRRCRRRLVGLALFVAFGAGAVVAVVDGARRNATALDRSVAAVIPADVIAVPNESGFDWGPIAELDVVTDLVEFLVLYFEVPELGGEFGGFPPGSPDATTEWERPVVLAGRTADPLRPDEVTVSPAVHELGVDIGDELTIRLTSWADVVAGTADPEQRDVAVTVVGVTKLSFFAWDVQPTYAFLEANRDLIVDSGGYLNALVRLSGGSRDVAAFERDLAAHVGRPVEVLRATEWIDSARQLVTFTTVALAALAAAVFLAVVLLVGQVVARIAGARPDELELLCQLGLSGRVAATSVLAAPGAAVALGLLVAPLLSYAVSDRFPIGLARDLEPGPGRQLDVVAAAGALAALGAVLVAVLALVAARLRRATTQRGAADNTVAEVVGRAPLSMPALLGTRLALTGTATGRLAPGLPWIVATGVTAIVAAATLAAGLDDAIDDPRLFGQGYEAAAVIYDPEPDRFMDVDAYAPMNPVGLALLTDTTASVNGQPVPLISARNLLGTFEPLARQGRAPVADDEIALSTQTMQTLGVAVGDEIDLAGESATVVGEVLTPELGHTAYTSGALVTHTRMERLIAGGATVKFQGVGIDLAPGADLAAAIELLDEPLRTFVQPWPAVPQQQALAATRQLPWVFAGFVALLTLGSTANVLAATTRARRHEVAVLQVLGLTRSQARRTVMWHAGISTVVGAVVGIPIGLAIGHTAWRAVVDSLPAIHRVPGVLPRTLLVGTVVVVAGLAAAAWPARRTARLEPALVLRSE